MRSSSAFSDRWLRWPCYLCVACRQTVNVMTLTVHVGRLVVFRWALFPTKRISLSPSKKMCLDLVVRPAGCLPPTMILVSLCVVKKEGRPYHFSYPNPSYRRPRDRNCPSSDHSVLEQTTASGSAKYLSSCLPSSGICLPSDQRCRSSIGFP